MGRSSVITSGHWMKQVYSQERWEKKLGDCEPGADADALGGGGGGGFGRIDIIPPRYSVSF